MAAPTELKVTTEMLWKGALILALIDIPFVFFLVRRVKRETFVHLKWTLVTTGAIFWFVLLAIMMSWIFWDEVYGYLFPAWARWLIPPVYTILFGAACLIFWYLAKRLPINPVLTWCLLGGWWGAITHIWAMYRGLIDIPPALQGISPIAIAVIPIFEFMWYWCLILTIAAMIQRMRNRKVAAR